MRQKYENLEKSLFEIKTYLLVTSTHASHDF